MKKIVLFSLLIISLLAGCQLKEDDPAPGERPDERLNQTLTQYKNQLTTAPFGWKAVLHTGKGAGYSFIMKFGTDDRVTMAGDVDASSATPMGSTYRVKALQKPTLLFDTYSYLHIIGDPDPRKSGGDVGQGKYSDFEFSFESVTPETITLTGNLQGSRLVLTKATQDEATNYVARITAAARAFESITRFTTYFKRLTLGSAVYDVHVDINARTITFIYFEGNVSRSFTTPFAYTENGVALSNAFTAGGVSITTLSNVQYNATLRRISFNANNTAGSIQESARPARIDAQAARNFVNLATGDDYWIAEAGFTINGKIDSLKIAEIPNFYFMVVWPKFGASGFTSYDLMGYIFLDPGQSQAYIGYGTAATPTVTQDGRLVYTEFGTLGTVPPADEPKVTAMKNIWTDPQGFYVVQVSSTQIDLVSAKDGKTWLNLYNS
ncbi:DUF4302 domain-containing protein [Adhaeribacter aquaticus]|uniref:DUF4302 domain-containing protein n=1 Tax=Adhaeribacter aquaticus TaxID=299567 RepID=UPI0003F6A9E0|nr:DUF4302 domain-containing protein [Adhaeribacter aquaticus]